MFNVYKYIYDGQRETETINDSMEIAYEPYHEQTTDTHWKILRNTTISQ